MKKIILALLLLTISNYGIAQKNHPFSLKVNIGYQHNYAYNLEDFVSMTLVEEEYFPNFGIRADVVLDWTFNTNAHINLGLNYYQGGYEVIYGYCGFAGCFYVHDDLKNDYLGPMLSFQYDFINRENFSLFIASGLTANFLLSNIDNSPNSSAVKLNKKSLSALFKSGLSYRHSKRISSLLSFHYQTALTAHNEIGSGSIYYYPYSFGMNLGMRYKL